MSDLHAPCAFVVPSLYSSPPNTLPLIHSNVPPSLPLHHRVLHREGGNFREESGVLGSQPPAAPPSCTHVNPSRDPLPCSDPSSNQLLSWKLLHQELSREPRHMDLTGQNAGSWASSQSLIHLVWARSSNPHFLQIGREPQAPESHFEKHWKALNTKPQDPGRLLVSSRNGKRLAPPCLGSPSCSTCNHTCLETSVQRFSTGLARNQHSIKSM